MNKQKKKLEISKSNKPFFWATMFLLGAILLTTFMYLLKQRYTDTPNITIGGIKGGVVADNQKELPAIYKSEMFGYKVTYPRSLTVTELGSGGGYIDFVRFEEEEDVIFKGFAVGVSEQSLQQEIKRIKNSLETEGAFLVEETAITVNDHPAAQLFYRPTKPEGFEERLITIFNNGEYTYSISTIPWQADEVLGRFEFLR